MKTAQFVLMAAVVLLSAGNPLEAQDTLYTAYVVAPGTIGDQNLVSVPQKLGMDFNVNQPIWIVSLGVFDSGGDGLRNSTAAHIFNRDTGALLTTLSFSKDELEEMGTEMEELKQQLMEQSPQEQPTA